METLAWKNQPWDVKVTKISFWFLPICFFIFTPVAALSPVPLWLCKISLVIMVTSATVSAILHNYLSRILVLIGMSIYIGFWTLEYLGHDQFISRPLWSIGIFAWLMTAYGSTVSRGDFG